MWAVERPQNLDSKAPLFWKSDGGLSLFVEFKHLLAKLQIVSSHRHIMEFSPQEQTHLKSRLFIRIGGIAVRLPPLGPIKELSNMF